MFSHSSVDQNDRNAPVYPTLVKPVATGSDLCTVKTGSRLQFARVRIIMESVFSGIENRQVSYSSNRGQDGNHKCGGKPVHQMVRGRLEAAYGNVGRVRRSLRKC